MLEFQAGRKDSFETLLRKYYPRLLNFIYRFVGNREAAEDLTQEVFIKVYQGASGYQPHAQFKTWLYTIARNISLNALRKNKNSGFSLDEDIDCEGDSLKRQLPDTRNLNPKEELVQKETARVVQEAIQALPENQRLAVILRRYEEFSYEEIAKTMNVSVEAVKSILNRAKENLKKSLAGYCSHGY